MSEKNKFSISQVPDYIKQDYSYDSESNNTNETIGTAINTSLTTARGIRISPTMILNANNSAVVNSEGYITQSGPIVFQINLPLPFLYSDRSDKRIVIRAIWFWVKNNNELSSVFEDSINKISFSIANFVNIDDGTQYGVKQTLLITTNPEYPINITNPFPMGSFNSYQSGDNRWKYMFERYVLKLDARVDGDGNVDYYLIGMDKDEASLVIQNIINKGIDNNSLPYYYSSAASDYVVDEVDEDGKVSEPVTNLLNTFNINNTAYGFSSWCLASSEECLTVANEYDTSALNLERQKINLIPSSSTNAYKFTNGLVYVPSQISTRRSDMNLITCPVISTLTTMTNSKGITSMMSNTPYDHPTEFISSSLPYFLLAFAKENGELYTIPEGVNVNDYCRVFVELTCLY